MTFISLFEMKCNYVQAGDLRGSKNVILVWKMLLKKKKKKLMSLKKLLGSFCWSNFDEPLQFCSLRNTFVNSTNTELIILVSLILKLNASHRFAIICSTGLVLPKMIKFLWIFHFSSLSLFLFDDFWQFYRVPQSSE